MTELSFTYAGVTVGSGGDSAYHLVDKYTYSVETDSVSLSFFVVVQDDAELTFTSKEAALRTAYSTPHSSLTVVLGATTRHTYDPTAGTGFNARPSIQKLGEDEDTGRSSKYECRVDIELPADLYSADGRRDHSMTVASDNSGIRTVSFQGEWTRSGATAGRAQYDAQIATFCDTQLAAIDGSAVWEQLPEQSTNDDRDNVIQFQRAYREIIDDQSLGSTDVASLRDAQLEIDVTDSGPGDSSPGSSGIDLGSVGGGTPTRLTEASVTYAASVDRSVVTGTSSIKSLYDGTVRPLLLNRAAAAMGGRTLVVVSETYSISPTSNALRVSMVVNADAGGVFITYAEDSEDDRTLPVELDTVWNGSDFDADRYHVPSPWLRTVTRTALYIEGRVPTALKDQQIRVPGFIERRRIQGIRRSDLGRLTGSQLPLVLETDIRIFQRYEARGSGGSARPRTGTL